MKITADTPAASLGGLEANAFQLTNSAKMIDIFINKMYTNKPGAVIRELAANAWDAHCENGNPEVPFEIHLPTWLEKTFMIRDYGCGIPHDKFENIYTNIGGSTKDDSDDFIGGFGLGSKTPFTMVDSFTVENWRDGKKSTWLCFKSAGSPLVTKLSEELSTEPTGVKVSFVFEDYEVAEFTKQLTKQLRYFPTKPIVTGGEDVAEWPELPDGWETQDYFYTKEQGWSRTHYVVMGNVAYELNTSELDHVHYSLFSRSLTLKVDIGTVDIPPSRENLEYTAKTKKYLNAALAKISKQYNDDFVKEINACTDWLDLRKKLYNANSSLISLRKFTFDGVEYDWSALSKSYLTSGEHTLTVKEISPRYKNVFRTTKIQMSDVIEGLALYVNDVGVGANAHINNEYSKIPSGCYIIDPPKGTTKTRQSLLDADIATAKKFFGIEPKLLSKVIGMPPKVSQATNRAKPDQIFKVIRTSGTVKGCLDKVDTIPTSGFMIPMSGWDAEDGKFRGSIRELGKFAGELDEPIYLVRKHTRKLCTSLQGEEELQKSLDKLLIPKSIEYQRNQELQGLLNSSQMSNLGKVNWKGVDSVLHLVLGFHFRMNKHSISYDEHQSIVSLLSEKPEASAFVSQRAKALIEKYNKRYKKLVAALGFGFPAQNFETLHNFISQMTDSRPSQENT
jgi:hypothetical protein